MPARSLARWTCCSSLRDRAGEVFDGSPVLFVYLHGPQITGCTHPRSDVDVAVYLDESTPTDQ